MEFQNFAYWITINYRESYGTMLAMEYCLITKAQLEEKRLLKKNSSRFSKD